MAPVRAVRTARAAGGGPPPSSPSKWVCADGTTEYIEPLIGVARHPFADVGCLGDEEATKRADLTSKYNITYIMLANNCDGGGEVSRLPSPLRGRSDDAGTTPRRLLFDMGCSVFREKHHGAWVDVHDKMGSGQGPSLPLLDGMFAKQCLPLDHLYGWEARPMDAAKWWAAVPPAVKPRLSFYNVPVVSQGDGNWTKTKRGTEGDFESRLKREAKEDDYVAVKLDIDYVPVEMAIMTRIGRPEVARLVDELMFEYHFNFDNLDFGWHSQVGGKNHVNDTVDDALAVMLKMRKLGVRAHFWI